MPKWFSNFKQKVVDHLRSSNHTRAVSVEVEGKEKVSKMKNEIFHSMRQLAYFTVRSNLPFNQFSTLCVSPDRRAR